MKRTPISPQPSLFPPSLRPLLSGGAVCDSSCSSQANVYFIHKDEGYYLKSAPAGTLAREAELTRYFYSMGLGPDCLAYLREDRDWLLTARVPGEDGTHRVFLDDPNRLADVTGTFLRRLHETPVSGCPAPRRTEEYLETVFRNYAAGKFHSSLRSPGWDFCSPEQAIAVVEESRSAFQQNTLIHGDYCLPNVMLKDWQVTGVIDLGSGGVGDRHIDLFWGMWSLWFNLKTSAYGERFLDAYGRDRVEPELLRAVAACERFA